MKDFTSYKFDSYYRATEHRSSRSFGKGLQHRRTTSGWQPKFTRLTLFTFLGNLLRFSIPIFFHFFHMLLASQSPSRAGHKHGCLSVRWSWEKQRNNVNDVNILSILCMVVDRFCFIQKRPFFAVYVELGKMFAKD